MGRSEASAQTRRGTIQQKPNLQTFPAHHLVSDHDSDPKLVSEPLQAAQEPSELYLPRRKLSPAVELRPEQGGGAVDDDDPKAGLCHHRGGCDEELRLVIAVVRAGVGDVVEDVLAVQTKPAGES